MKSDVHLFGHTVFENAVIKLTNYPASAALRIKGTVEFKTGEYTPLILTSQNDSSIGESLPWSTGNPWTNYCGLPALEIDSYTSGQPASIKHVRVSHAYTALSFYTGTGHEVKHAQIVHSSRAFSPYYADVRLRNVLVYQADRVVSGSGAASATMRFEHLTAHQANHLNWDSGSGPSSTMFLTNCLFVVTNAGAYTGANNASNTSSSVFSVVGSGAHYLAGATYRGLGTTNLNTNLLGAIRARTTQPPLTVTNGFLVADTTLNPRSALRYTNNAFPDLGFHYPILDHVFGSVSLTNVQLAVNPGTAVGLAIPDPGNYALLLADGARLLVEGSPTNLARLIRAHLVQEQANNAWKNHGFSIVLPWWSANPAPSVSLRFAQVTTVYDEILIGYNQPANISMRDSQIHGGALYNFSGSAVGVTNCLWDRVYLSADLSATPGAALRHNLFRGGIFEMFPAADTTVRDNLFDRTSIPYLDNVTSSHNGYVAGCDRLLPTNSTDKVLASLTYDTGLLGNYYLSAGSALIDAGSQSAASAGMVHYTALASQAKDSGFVDIGLHYVATGANGAPHDSDGEGLIDALEDKNGNATKDTTETDPLRADTDADGLTDYQEVVLIGSAITNPLLWDTNGNGVNDADEDADGDLISNGGELALGTKPIDAFSLNRASNGNIVNKDGEFLAAAEMTSQSGNGIGRLKPLEAGDIGPTTITLTLLDAIVPFIYDIYHTPDLNLTWQLHYRGLYDQTVFIVPKPSGANAFFEAGSAQDWDGDGLTDGFEALVTDTSISVPEPDSDGDGLLNGVELVLTGTDPNDADTGNTGTSDGYKDLDADGLTNLEEFNLGKNSLQPNVASPIFDPVGRNYSSAQYVIITCPTADAVIHYRTDGAEPTESDQVISSGSGIVVGVQPATTLKARAWKTGWLPSETESQVYRHVGFPANALPTVTITPASGGTFLASDSIEILVQASDSDGTISKVQVFRGNYKVAESPSSPLRYRLNNVSAGTYTFTAKAIDNSGAVFVTTPPITITINAPVPVVSLVGAQPFFTASPGKLLANITGVNPTALTGLTLNGVPLPIPKAGSFSLDVPLAQGENTFTLVATDNQSHTAQGTTKVYLDSVLPAISITAPANNSSFTVSRINVLGTFTETSLRRIIVNGVPAFISGNSFEARNVTLGAGANIITATGEDIAGNLTTTTISVTGSASPADPVQLTVTPVGGFAPLNTTFQIQASVPGTLQQVLYDFNGDCVVDQTAANLNSIAHNYAAAGEYFPVVTIVTTTGRFSSIGGWNVIGANALMINVQQPPIQQNVINVTDPVDVKIGASGHLYVLSRSTATILQYDANGAVVRSLAAIGTTPRGLDVDNAGNVYVALSGNNQVAKYKPAAGSFQLDTTFNTTGRIGKADQTSGSGNGEFNAPYDVAITPDGEEIAVTDSSNHRIQRFKKNGAFLNSLGTQGTAIGQFNTPKGLAYDSSGYLYIVDSGNNRIALALASGVLGISGSSGTALGQFQGSVNLGVGSRGIYVADTGNNRVQQFDALPGGHAEPTPFAPRGALSDELTPDLNQPNSVASVADFREERIYIADTGNNRVVLVKLPIDNPEAVWALMKDRVNADDINGAIDHFSSLAADEYRLSFTSIGLADLKPLISQIPTITPVVINRDSALYRFERVVQGFTITFPIEFVKENGLWKIDSY